MFERLIPNVPRAALACATIAGVTLGVAYAASPLTVWFVIVMSGVFLWAGRGLADRERRWVWGILTAAVALRVLAIAVLFLASDHHQSVSFFWDGDGVALKRRALWIRNVWLGVPIAPLDFWNAFDRLYGWSTYLHVIAYVQYLVGPAAYGVHLFNVCLFMSAMVGLYRVARSAYGRAPALIGLGALLFLPTPLFWSVSALKESLYLFLEVMGMVALFAVLRTTGWFTRGLGVAVLTGTLASINTVRVGGLLIEAAGLAIGVMGSLVVRRVSLVLLLLLLLPIGGRRLLNDAALQAQIMTRLRTSAVLHIGNVRTEGHAYKLLDQRFYSEDRAKDPIATMTPMEAARFVVRAFVSFVIVPLPWQVQSFSEIAFLPQQIVWYALVLLAVVGFVAGLRCDALVTCTFAGLATIGSAVIALNSGNIGTMIRFRDTIVPFVVWLSALGAVSVASRMMTWCLIGRAPAPRLEATQWG